MEDARVDLGAADVSTPDTGRLLLVSFATVFGNDWFLVPLEAPAASPTVLERLLVRDVNRPSPSGGAGPGIDRRTRSSPLSPHRSRPRRTRTTEPWQ
ncbi:hypothetical protein [Streptomyces sp. NPDC046979]|uniref:hypothetical protein n=1 Tax=Streptomyces sp. NPDC046979 TaxID=3154604 RepID=UPI0033C78EEA